MKRILSITLIFLVVFGIGFSLIRVKKEHLQRGKNEQKEQIQKYLKKSDVGRREVSRDVGKMSEDTSESQEENSKEEEGENTQQATSQSNTHSRGMGGKGKTQAPSKEEKGNTYKKKLLPLRDGRIYFSAFPDFGGTEDNVSTQRVRDFEKLIGRDIFWATFSQNWGRGMEYPRSKIDAIYRAGAVPLIRFMPRTNFDEGCSDQSFSLEKIRAGNFDDVLRAWARAAKQDGRMLLIDFAVEMNGDWFPWSGVCHGKNPQIYKNAYRHIIDIFREEGVLNVTWFFHFDINTVPYEKWNLPKEYYPGDDYIDWVGFSAYGPLHEREDYWETLSEMVTRHAQEVKAVTYTKPLALMEFGVTDHNPNGSKVKWLQDAFETILKGTPLRFRAINYWHENWEEEDGVYALLRVDSSPESLEVFRKYAKNSRFSPPIENHISPHISEVNERPHCVYNQAYTENDNADTLEDILHHARGCYVLVDPFDMTASERQKLPTIVQHNTLSCYMSIGTAEDWRDDFSALKPFASTKQWSDWEGEYFISNISQEVVNVMKARIAKLANDGCEYVEFDNMDWADEDNINEYHLNITPEASHRYARTLCKYAHSKGLKCMAKSTNFDDALFDGLTVESYPDYKNWWAENELKGVLWREGIGLIVHYNENHCDDAERYYRSIYGDKFLFLCEKRGGGYVHDGA